MMWSRSGLMVCTLDSGSTGRVLALAGTHSTLCCVPGQVVLLSQCLSPPRCANEYLRI